MSPLFLGSNGKVFAEDFSVEQPFGDPGRITIQYSGFTLNTCYIVRVYNQSTKQYMPRPPGTLDIPCEKNLPDKTGPNSGEGIFYSSKQLSTDGSLLLTSLYKLPSGSYSLSLHKQTCGLGELRCSLETTRTKSFHVSLLPPPLDCELLYPTTQCGGTCNGTAFDNENTISVATYYCSDGTTKDVCRDLGKIPDKCGYAVVTPTPTPPVPPCNKWVEIDEKTGAEKSVILNGDERLTDGKTLKTCKEFNTAVGVIATDPVELIKRIFTLILGLSGGIALILIIFSGYRIMTSQGNEEKLQGAKETLTSAITGFLFIIFSVVILEVIGVDILGIPGLGK